MIHVYAEHLLNIRTLTIQASLPTVSNAETKASLSVDGSLWTLHHEDEEASIRLPVVVIGEHSHDILTIRGAQTKNLSFRVLLQEKSGPNAYSSGQRTDDGMVDPWTAASLDHETEISCEACAAVLIPRGKVQHWKDLPSEGWAEMMDFWHCHKPDVPHEHNESAGCNKAYSATGKLAIEPRVGLVGDLEFVFTAEDMQCVERGLDPSSQEMFDYQLSCAQCHSPLGSSHGRDTDGGFLIRKSRLAISSASHSTSYSYEKWFTSHLLRSVESQGVRKFIVQEPSAQPAAIKIWVFQPDLVVSSSALATAEPLQVTKVLWQDCEPAGVNCEKLNLSKDEGEIELPRHEFRELTAVLEASSKLLPESARSLQQWRVALLRRFTSEDISG